MIQSRYLLLLALVAIAGCKTLPADEAQNIATGATQTLEHAAEQAETTGDTEQADIFRKSSGIIGSIPWATLADENGNVNVLDIQRYIASQTGGDPALESAIAGAIVPELERRAIPPDQIAYWIGSITLLGLIGRKAVPALMVVASGTPYGAIVKSLAGLFFSFSTWERGRGATKKSPPA